MKKNMAIKIMVLLSFLPVYLLAQNCDIQGKAIDKNTKKALSNVKVIFFHMNDKNLKFATMTDEKGKFLLQNVCEKGGYPVGSVIRVVAIPKEPYLQNDFEIIVGDNSNEVLELVIPPKMVSQTFQIHHRNPIDIFEMLRANGFVNISIVENLRTITINNYPEKIAEAARLIDQYDQPLKTIRIEVKLLEASKNGRSQPDIPDEIKPILEKLNSLFKFGHYEIVGRADAMGIEGATLAFSTPRHEDMESFFHVATRLDLAGDIIKLQDLKVEIRMPSESNLVTSVNIRNGETLILGASKGDPQKRSLITVVTAKILD